MHNMFNEVIFIYTIKNLTKEMAAMTASLFLLLFRVPITPLKKISFLVFISMRQSYVINWLTNFSPKWKRLFIDFLSRRFRILRQNTFKILPYFNESLFFCLFEKKKNYKKLLNPYRGCKGELKRYTCTQKDLLFFNKESKFEN